LFSTHVHTNNTGNVTKQTIYRTTQKYIEQHKKYIEQHKKYIEQHKKYIEQHKKYIEQHKQYIEQHKQYIEQHNNYEECGPCPVFAGFTLAFALQLRKKHGKTPVRVVIHKHTVRIRSHNNKNT
jgi:hypothetical protein